MKINIKNKLDESNITRYEIAKRLGITYITIDKLYKGNGTSIKFSILEALCVELNCTPNDILMPENETLKNLFVQKEKR